MSDLETVRKNAWDKYSSNKDKKKMNELGERYIDFLSECKTEREVINYCINRLQEHGYEEYSEDSKSNKIYQCFKGKSLFVANRGKLPLAQGMHLISAHADAPRLDFKQQPLQEQVALAQAKTHYYGGIRKYQWFARPLALHGVVALKSGELKNIVIGEDENDPVFTIADLLPHLSKSQDTKVLSEAFEGEKMNIILGHSPSTSKDTKAKNNKSTDEKVKKNILELLNNKYEITEADFYSAEIEVVPSGRARKVGLDEALIGGYAQDDRICVFTALESFLNNNKVNHTNVLILWDKEETGSEGATGADSKFLEYALQDMLKLWESSTDFRTLMRNSKAISADVHAAIDPDWQDLHEKMNAATIGYGPCLCKFTGSRGKYGSSDASCEYVAYLRNIFDEKNLVWQMAELGKVDGGGGGTVALFLAAYGLDVIDMGPAVLSMHSPFELSSLADLLSTKDAYLAFYQAV